MISLFEKKKKTEKGHTSFLEERKYELGCAQGSKIL